LIDQVKIGAMTYRVKELSDLHRVDDEGRKQWLFGQILHQSAEIRLEHDQTEMVKRATLLHEIMHGVLHRAGFEEHPETAIIALGYGLLEVLRDNPALVDLLRESP
jgi:hypothetical protein